MVFGRNPLCCIEGKWRRPTEDTKQGYTRFGCYFIMGKILQQLKGQLRATVVSGSYDTWIQRLKPSGRYVTRDMKTRLTTVAIRNKQR